MPLRLLVWVSVVAVKFIWALKKAFSSIAFDFRPSFHSVPFNKKKPFEFFSSKKMLRVQAPTAFKDVTFNNVKASRSSINDLYAQSITRIEGGVSLEVFETLTALNEQIRVLTEQNTALLARITAFEARPVVAAAPAGGALEQRLAALETRVNELVVE
jgi:hypothetical protein